MEVKYGCFVVPISEVKHACEAMVHADKWKIVPKSKAVTISEKYAPVLTSMMLTKPSTAHGCFPCFGAPRYTIARYCTRIGASTPLRRNQCEEIMRACSGKLIPCLHPMNCTVRTKAFADVKEMLEWEQPEQIHSIVCLTFEEFEEIDKFVREHWYFYRHCL